MKPSLTCIPEGVVKKMKTMGLDTEAYDNRFVNFTNDLLYSCQRCAVTVPCRFRSVGLWRILASATRGRETLLELSPVIRIRSTSNASLYHIPARLL